MVICTKKKKKSFGKQNFTLGITVSTNILLHLNKIRLYSIRLNWINWSEIQLNEIGSELSWIGLIELNFNEIQLNWIELKCNWVGLNYLNQLNWIKLSWVELKVDMLLHWFSLKNFYYIIAYLRQSAVIRRITLESHCFFIYF